ncbi:hypothetical protein ACT5DV_003667, partial [Vibrio cholerae]
TTAAHWDWKRRALTVPLEAFVNWLVLMIFTTLTTNTKKITLLFVWCFYISGWLSEHEKSASFTRCSRRLLPSSTKILEIISSSFEMTTLSTTKHLQIPFAQMLLVFPFCQLTPA